MVEGSLRCISQGVLACIETAVDAHRKTSHAASAAGRVFVFFVTAASRVPPGIGSVDCHVGRARTIEGDEIAAAIQNKEVSISNGELDRERLVFVEVGEIGNILGANSFVPRALEVINPGAVGGHHDVLATQEDINLIAGNAKYLAELVGGGEVQRAIEREEGVIPIRSGNVSASRGSLVLSCHLVQIDEK